MMVVGYFFKPSTTNPIAGFCYCMCKDQSVREKEKGKGGKKKGRKRNTKKEGKRDGDQMLKSKSKSSILAMGIYVEGRYRRGGRKRESPQHELGVNQRQHTYKKKRIELPSAFLLQKIHYRAVLIRKAQALYYVSS